MTFGVSASDDEDDFIHETVVQCVWELREQNTSGVAMDNRVCLRIARNGSDGNVDGALERATQSGALRFVPSESILDIGLGRGREDDRLHRDCRRFRTSDHGRPKGRPARMSSSTASSRRSSSAR